jgi:hypothetical protein
VREYATILRNTTMKLATLFCRSLIPLFVAQADGFSSTTSDARHTMVLQQQATNDEDILFERRHFLSHAFVSCIATLAAGPAVAADDKGTMTMQAPRNRKIGGLALKIRAVTNVMVRNNCADSHICDVTAAYYVLFIFSSLWFRTNCNEI